MKIKRRKIGIVICAVILVVTNINAYAEEINVENIMPGEYANERYEKITVEEIEKNNEEDILISDVETEEEKNSDEEIYDEYDDEAAEKDNNENEIDNSNCTAEEMDYSSSIKDNQDKNDIDENIENEEDSDRNDTFENYEERVLQNLSDDDVLDILYEELKYGDITDELSYYYNTEKKTLELTGTGSIENVYGCVAELPWAIYYEEMEKIEFHGQIKARLWQISKRSAELSNHLGDIDSVINQMICDKKKEIQDKVYEEADEECQNNIVEIIADDNRENDFSVKNDEDEAIDVTTDDMNIIIEEAEEEYIDERKENVE